MSYFKAKMHQIRSPGPLTGFEGGPTSKGREGYGREGKGRGKEKKRKKGGKEGKGSGMERRKGRGGEGGRTTLRTPCRKFLATPL